jgi:hypothetical protein
MRQCVCLKQTSTCLQVIFVIGKVLHLFKNAILVLVHALESPQSLE